MSKKRLLEQLYSYRHLFLACMPQDNYVTVIIIYFRAVKILLLAIILSEAGALELNQDNDYTYSYL